MFRDLWGTQCREMISISQEWNSEPAYKGGKRAGGRARTDRYEGIWM